MIYSRHWRLCVTCVALAISASAKPQQPFDLDMSFRTVMDTWYVSSIAPLSNGDILVSGQVKFPNDLVFRALARITSQGEQVVGFPYSYGGGKLTAWNGQYYVASSQTTRRLLSTGLVDDSFIHMNSGPYFSSGQGGDYHVFDDGRVLMSGVHLLDDVARGYIGYYCLCWFSNEGYLDTTRVHRTCSGTLDCFQALPDGKFIGSGSTSTYDGQPASNIFRFNADGSLDPSFQANVTWGSAFGFLPLADGRVYAAGEFRITGVQDTLRLVRFMPDGSLDPTFNNTLHFERGELSGAYGAIPSFIYPLDDTRLIVTGGYRSVEGQVRKGICAVDTSGNLLDYPFESCGGGTYQYQGLTTGTVRGIVPAPDGSFYVWGSFHGYDDGTTNDTTQRMVSRLYGLDVGVREAEGMEPVVLRAHPNPATAQVTFAFDRTIPAGSLVVRDMTGHEVWRRTLTKQEQQVVWDAQHAAPGIYTATLYAEGQRLGVEKLTVVR